VKRKRSYAQVGLRFSLPMEKDNDSIQSCTIKTGSQLASRPIKGACFVNRNESCKIISLGLNAETITQVI